MGRPSEAARWERVRDRLAQEWGRPTGLTFDRVEADPNRPLGVLQRGCRTPEAEGSQDANDFFAGLQERIARGIEGRRGDRK